MKKPWLLGILLIAVIFVACCLWILWPRFVSNNSGQANLAVPKSIVNLPLSKLRRIGNVTVARLQSPAIIDGFPCAASWVHFGESARLKAFYLGETCTIQGYEIPKGTWVQLNPDQTLRFCAFPEDTNIQGYVCDGGKGGSEGLTTGFYPSGRLSSFFPPKDIEIQGIPCKGSLYSPIYFFENGNLKEFTLSRDAVIGGRALSGGKRVIFNEQGQVQSVSSHSIFERAGSWLINVFR
jgi:hypothetical protein